MGILTSCTPRADLITGDLNLEIFTASLSSVLKKYRGEETISTDLYTDAHKFFTEGTYFTEGLKSVLTAVVRRLSGDNGASSLYRLDTAFGGGKSHSLIACVHVAERGKELADELKGILGPETISRLPDPGSVNVVGISCDELSLYKVINGESVPYTLWGEIARQIGGDELYQSLGRIVTSRGAPGVEDYFDKVFKGRKVLLLIDEIAQYGIRLEKDERGGAAALCAFLLALDGYARTNSGISVVLTLATSQDAFASMTRQIDSIFRTSGNEGDVSEDNKRIIVDEAMRELNSVVARSAVNVTPVASDEISRVLIKRLFSDVDEKAAQTTASAYAKAYAKTPALLPDIATKNEYERAMVQDYPFHPSFIDFLNHKLAASSTFQGTRGVLRMLSLCVSNLWRRGEDIDMIHDCDLDLSSDAITSELFGKTGSGSLRPVLVTDICSGDAEHPATAEMRDNENPHPNYSHVYRDTWECVFLNSLIGSGIQDKAFGIDRKGIVLEVLRPAFSASNIDNALKDLEDRALFLQYNSPQNKYFASTEPSINKILLGIRTALAREETEVDRYISRKMSDVAKSNNDFNVLTGIREPTEVEDKPGKPTVVFISIYADNIDASDFFRYKSASAPRVNQNNLILMVPKTVNYTLDAAASFFNTADIERNRHYIREMATDYLAMKKLMDNPSQYNVKPERLKESGLEAKVAARDLEVLDQIAKTYRTMLYPKDNPRLYDEAEIETSSIESGAATLEKIREILVGKGKIITETDSRRTKELRALFFSESKTGINLGEVRQNLKVLRSWPMISSESVLDKIIRAGVEAGSWAIVYDDSETGVKVRYYREEPLKITTELQDIWNLVPKYEPPLTVFDPVKAKQRVADRIKTATAVSVKALNSTLRESFPKASDEQIRNSVNDAINDLKISDTWFVYTGEEEQQEKPKDLIPLKATPATSFGTQEVLIQKSECAGRGWSGTVNIEPIKVTGIEAQRIIKTLLRRLGSVRDVKSVLDISIMEISFPFGGTQSLELSKLQPPTIQANGEYFSALSDLINPEQNFDASIIISVPVEGCGLVKEINALLEMQQ